MIQASQQKQIDFSKLVQIVLKRKWFVLICIIGAILPIIYYNKVSLPVYEASSKIVCEETRGSISNLDSSPTRLRNTFVENQIQEIQSWSLANEVVKVLPDSILNSILLPEELPRNFNKFEFFTSIIQENTTPNGIPNSDVIKISVQAHNANAACSIANTIAEVLEKRNLDSRLGDIHNVRNTIEDQLEYFKKRVEESEKSLKKFKEKNKITNLDQESQEIFSRITQAEIEHNRVKAEMAAAKKRLIFIRNKLVQERKDLVPSITETTTPRAQRLKGTLIDLEVQYTTLKVQNYSDNHPQMTKLKSQIEETKSNLREECIKIAKGEDISDPLSTIQRNLEEISSLEVEIYTYEAQEKALYRVIDDYNRNLKSVPEKELELGRLQRDKTVADNIYTMLLQQREEAKITEAEKFGNIRIIDPARVPKNPIKPRRMLNLIIGFIIGCSIGIGLSFLIESLDKSIKTVEEVENYIDIPVLSTIPKISSRYNGKLKNLSNENSNNEISKLASKLIVGRNPKSPASEAFRTLRTSLQFAKDGSSVKTVMVTSSRSNEGKSLITANLAISTAQLGLNTLLVDLDLRKPVQHQLFEKEQEPGIMDIILRPNKNNDLKRTDILNNEEAINAHYVQEVTSQFNKVKYEIEMGNLNLLTCGKIPPNPSEILSSRAIKKMFDSFKESYDVIIFDAPPVLAVTDATILAHLTDGVIIVIRAGKNSQKEILRTKELIQRAKGNLIGSVLNDVETGSYYGYYNDSKYYDHK